MVLMINDGFHKQFEVCVTGGDWLDTPRHKNVVCRGNVRLSQFKETWRPTVWYCDSVRYFVCHYHHYKGD